ncbi:MAG: PEP-CTERM sorting domain-containing protein [Planctomycetota bacterium]
MKTVNVKSTSIMLAGLSAAALIAAPAVAAPLLDNVIIDTSYSEAEGYAATANINFVNAPVGGAIASQITGSIDPTGTGIVTTNVPTNFLRMLTPNGNNGALPFTTAQITGLTAPDTIRYNLVGFGLLADGAMGNQITIGLAANDSNLLGGTSLGMGVVVSADGTNVSIAGVDTGFNIGEVFDLALDFNVSTVDSANYDISVLVDGAVITTVTNVAFVPSASPNGNASGIITTDAGASNFQFDATRLSIGVVPEPAALSLLAAGGLLMACRRRSA